MKIETLRADIAALQAERAALEGQPLGPADVRAAVERSIDGLAGEWGARCDLMLTRIAAGTRAGEAIGIALDPADHPRYHNVDKVALVGLIGADAIKAALLARLDNVVAPGPNAADRAARIAAIDRELDRLEAAEERLIVESEQAGAPIARRDDCRIEVVLALVGDAPAEEAHVTSDDDEIEAQQTRAKRRVAAKRLEAASEPVPSRYLQRSRP